MPPALDLARKFVHGRTICMGMPDTLVESDNCFAELLAFHYRRNADVSLGVFPTEDPRSLAPVVLEPTTGRVLDIVDKPEHSPAANSWGIAVWSPEFTELLHSHVAASAVKAAEPREQLMTDVFLHGIRAGLQVYGLEFPACGYFDIGTPARLLRARQQFELCHYQADGDRSLREPHRFVPDARMKTVNGHRPLD